MNDRAKLFEDDDLDLSDFKPKEGSRPAGPDPEQVRAVSEAAQFSSREPKAVRPKPAAAAAPAAKAEPAAPKREPRRHRTGRTIQFNCRTTPACADGMYAIADSQGWLVGETLERAYAALKRELEGQEV
ncbi:hypothetical protein MMSR116_18180 [Methylobacterium mesophilicum SR1.6/6]|uniref:Stability/partitioning determinant n=1 Tax=Methylobacterium mesophilicum SR1.6/6 TaxID=908290 RepID=A0A6B9FLZ8_9HYPH|nr:hypothetical protein [Methylobacterium mesophilicum]QGY03600.1 hypothetical protein MMSR116_18180 [Methylobacterium mesophilicum SR1.6/6]